MYMEKINIADFPEINSHIHIQYMYEYNTVTAA